jgi:hypothetical protein
VEEGQRDALAWGRGGQHDAGSRRGGTTLRPWEDEGNVVASSICSINFVRATSRALKIGLR